MSLQSTAQELVVVDPAMDPHMGGETHMQLIPVELEVEDPNPQEDYSFEPMEIVDEPVEFEVVDLPGAPPGTTNPEPELEVLDEETDKSDAQDEDSKPKKGEKWDWSSHGSQGFVNWIRERLMATPSHSGYDTAGIERAIAYLERLDNEVSRAMRSDLDGELDANQIEQARSNIDKGIALLQDRIEAIKSTKKKTRKKKAELDSEGFMKEAQKITGVQGVFVTVPLLISRIARVCINGTVSAGHDIEDLYKRQVDFYKLSTREQAEVQQLLSDMGYVVRQDRGFMPDQDVDITSSDNMDWAANYKG